MKTGKTTTKKRRARIKKERGDTGAANLKDQSRPISGKKIKARTRRRTRDQPSTCGPLDNSITAGSPANTLARKRKEKLVRGGKEGNETALTLKPSDRTHMI